MLSRKFSVMPNSIRIVIVCWILVAQVLGGMIWRSMLFSSEFEISSIWSQFFCHTIATGVIGIPIAGLLCRSAVGWWWNRLLAITLAAICIVLWMLVAVYAVITIAGGIIPEKMNFLVLAIILVGISQLIFSPLCLGAIYGLLDTQKARQYCFVGETKNNQRGQDSMSK